MSVRKGSGSPAVVGDLAQGSAEGFRAFETLLAKLASALLQVPADDLDAEINHSLKTVAIVLGLDRISVAEVDPATGRAAFTHGWARDSDQMNGSTLDPKDSVPWSIAKMLEGNRVLMSSPGKLPEEAAVDRESFYRFGPESSVMIPLKVGETVVGAVSFGTANRQKNWSSKTVRRLHIVAQIIRCGLERKRLLAEVAHLRNQLIFVSRITTMGQLAASIAHELNQPLGAILTNAEEVQRIVTSDHADLDEVRSCVGDIVQDTNRASDTIHRVWSLFRRDKVTTSEIDVAEILDEIGRMVRSDALIRNISLSVDVQRPIPAIFAERVQLQQALLNLILNAFDALMGIDDRPREVHVRAMSSPENDCVVIHVRDCGKGIAPDNLAKIFDAFFTTKPNGMGVGLAIAKSIIAAHGGSLSATPNPDHGTTFEITIPASNRATK